MAGGWEATAKPVLNCESLALSRATIAGARWALPERSSSGFRPKKNKP